MITREELRELAELEFNGREDCALSFYFQPHTPQNKSHHEEVILAKDLVRSALHEAEKLGKNGFARADLKRILELAENLQGNKARAKAVFACGNRHYWREFDLPPQLSATQLFVDYHFQLKPLAMLLGGQPRLWVLLIDRQRARFFDLRLDELKEHEGIPEVPSRRVRSDGYDAGHLHKREQDDALHHFKTVAQHLKQAQEKGQFDRWIIGCREASWSGLELHLHSYVKERLLGRFSGDIGSMPNELIREQARSILKQALDRRCHELAEQVIGQAKGDGRGVTGLRRVLRSLEGGEVQTLIVAENYSAHAVECTACGHLDAHMVRYCPMCGHGTRELEDVCNALIPAAIRRDIELLYVSGLELDRVGNIAALLRFRADRSKGSPIVAA
jgi:peptide chain release factor subunit 1